MALVSASMGAMHSLLAKLAALDKENKLPKEVKHKMKSLSAELNLMSCLLEKLARTEDSDPLVKGWMKQLREMTYDYEDYIDDLNKPDYQLGLGNAAKQIGFVHKVAERIKKLKARHQVARQIEEINQRIKEAADRSNRYKLDDAAKLVSSPSKSFDEAAVAVEPRVLLMSADEESLVGIQGPRKELMELLAPAPEGQQQQSKVVSIVGFGGIGKSTLAVEVYRSLKGRFDCHAVVSVSRRPDLRTIMRSILSQVKSQPRDSFEQLQLKDILRALKDFLCDKRYFVLIQDVWDASAWKVISLAFPENGDGSRILVTTRINDVAKSCCNSHQDLIFHMKPYNDEEARKLFFRRIFHPEACPPQLEKISAAILKKCGGLPLAITTVAGLLATKSKAEEEWMTARDSIDYVDNPEGIMRILNFCYADLPIQLRTCLLYLSIFPEEYVIDKAQLIRRWIAEGFVEAGSMGLGESYFNGLINRGLIQPVGIQYNGRVKACRVHHIILDFIKCKSAEENFVTMYDGSDHNFELQDRVRRLSLEFSHDQYGEDNFIPLETNYSHVRSLTVFMFSKKMPDLGSFQALRVLDLQSRDALTEYLRNIGRLHLLRYLRLQTASATELPEQIGECVNLEILDLTGAKISTLPESIVRLTQLTCLLVKNVKLLDGFLALQALQELLHVAVDSSNSLKSLEELGGLPKLRVLGLNWRIADISTSRENWAASLVSSLNNLGSNASSLQCLHMGNASGCSLNFLLDLSAPFYLLQEFRMTSDYYFPRVPEWMASLANLTMLEINIIKVGEELLQFLGKLRSLLVLLLSVESTAPEQGLIIRDCRFQCLKQFDFICQSSLGLLMFEEGTMDALEKLQLKFLAKIASENNEFKFGTKHLASLRHVSVDIDCIGPKTEEVKDVEDAIKSALRAHPNQPTLELGKWREEHMEEEEGHKDEVDIDVVKEEVKPLAES